MLELLSRIVECGAFVSVIINDAVDYSGVLQREWLLKCVCQM
jgi:hypothetical protein